RPVKELKAFAKVRLGPGESTAVGFELGERPFAYYDVADEDWPALLERHPVSWAPREGPMHRRAAGWYVVRGSYQVHVGRSSAEIAHTVMVDVFGSTDPLELSGPLG